jgi:hypothetical protein
LRVVFIRQHLHKPKGGLRGVENSCTFYEHACFFKVICQQNNVKGKEENKERNTGAVQRFLATTGHTRDATSSQVVGPRADCNMASQEKAFQFRIL